MEEINKNKLKHLENFSEIIKLNDYHIFEMDGNQNFPLCVEALKIVLKMLNKNVYFLTSIIDLLESY